MKRNKSFPISLFLIHLVILLILFTATGCGSSNTAVYENDSAGTYSEEAMAERGMSQDIAPAEPAAPSPDVYSTADGEGFDLGDAREIGHKIIYTGEVIMETLTFDKSVEEMQEYVADIGGYAESSFIEGRRITETSRPSKRSAVFTFRVPQHRFHSFSKSLKEFGNVLSSSTHGENITERYFDTEARLTSLKIQEERMLSLLERADNIEDILRIESELTHLRYQIESLTGTLQKWDNLVDFSTIRVEIREVDQVTLDPETATWFDEIGEAFKDSVLAVIKTLQNLIIFLIMVVPFAIVFIPFFFILYKLYRSYRNKKIKDKINDGTSQQ